MVEFFDTLRVQLVDALSQPHPVHAALWQSTLCLGLGLAAARLVDRRPGRAHAILLLALIAAVAAPFATWLCAERGWGFFPAVGTGNTAAIAGLPGGSFASTSTALEWESIALAIWCGASLVFSVRVLRSLLRARSWIAKGTQPAGPELAARATLVSRRLGLRAVPEVHLAGDVDSPLIWCWSPQPRVLVPARNGAAVRESVLCHELAHLKRRDHWSSLVAEVVRCLLPWNPLAHLATKRLATLSERACDAWVLTTGEDRFDYAATLLELVPQRTIPGVPAAAHDASGLASRVHGLVNGTAPSPSTGRVAVALACGVTLVAVSGLSLAQRAAPEGVALEARSVPAAALESDGEPLRLYPAELDLGLTAPDTPASGTLWFVNLEEEPVRVEKVRAHCGCTTVVGLEAGSVVPARSSVALAVTMTAAPAGEAKTKNVSVELEGGRVLIVPVHLRTEP